MTESKHSIEVYDDKFDRPILTRSARVRKFKFYQYKPVQESTPKTTRECSTSQANNSTSLSVTPEISGSETFLEPREDVLQGKIGLTLEQSKEISELDNEIIALEKKIADLNSGNSNDNLDEIFNLVNKKNDVLRRQMQLNILEKEKILEKTNEELTKELRALMSIDDSMKSQSELDRQQYLYDQLLALVDKRNELVLHMDVQEKGIEDDNALKARLKTAISDTSARSRTGQDQNCSIQ